LDQQTGKLPVSPRDWESPVLREATLIMRDSSGSAGHLSMQKGLSLPFLLLFVQEK
jgi:hypothetical protein